MSDDSTSQIIGTIGGCLSSALFWVNACIANERLIIHLERRASQHRSTDRVPMLKDSRGLFYSLAVVCSVGYCASALLQIMVFPPIETSSPQSDLLDCLFIAAYLATVSMTFFTTWDGVTRVQRLTSSRNNIISSLGPSKQSSHLAMQATGSASVGSKGPGAVAPHSGDPSSKNNNAPGAGGGGASELQHSGSSSRKKSKKKEEYRNNDPRQDTEVVAKFYGGVSDPKVSSVSMSTKNSATAMNSSATMMMAGRTASQLSDQPQPPGSSGEDSRAVLRLASRGSGTFHHSDDDEQQQQEDDNDDPNKIQSSRSSAVQTGSFLEGYDEEEEWGTGFQQMGAHYDPRFGPPGGTVNETKRSNDPSDHHHHHGAPAGSADLIEDESEECVSWMKENRCALTISLIIIYYLLTTLLDFIYQQQTGKFVSFGSYGSALMCVIFGIVSGVGGVSCILVYRGLPETAAAAADTLRLLASIFFILCLFLVTRSIIVFQPVQDSIGATLLPATLYLVDAFSILLLLLRVPKTK